MPGDKVATEQMLKLTLSLKPSIFIEVHDSAGFNGKKASSNGQSFLGIIDNFIEARTV